MIENFLKKGIRVIWTCPRPTGKKMDGTIHLCPATSDTMTYDGLDGDLLYTGGHIRELGLKMGDPISFSWLDYIPGCTAKTTSNDDVLTGPMSGCLITTWGGSWIAHVGTVDNQEDVSKKVKETFAELMKTEAKDARGFNPMKAWPIEEISTLQDAFKNPLIKSPTPKKGAPPGPVKQLPIPTPRIMGLVTASKEFYSVLMFLVSDYQNKNWIIGGSKKMEGMRGKQLSDTLLGLIPPKPKVSIP